MNRHLPTVPAAPPPGTRVPASDLDQAPDLIDQLMRPEAWPFPVERVERLETHVSQLFFVGHRVYKLKKAVHLAFLDQTTLDQRRHACHEELRLNARLAPDMYLGVVPITREANGSLCVQGDGEVVEVAVAMQRLPADRLLDHLLDEGCIDNDRVRELAETLSTFHQFARTGMHVDEYGTPQAVRDLVLSNLEQLAPFVAEAGGEAPSGVRILSPELHGFLTAQATRFLDAHETLLQKRVDSSRIREGHGDLHAGNICCTDEGIVAYDCIEFSRAIRCCDVACDLAFLAMDLDSRGFRAFARRLVRDYQALSRDRGLGYLIDFYKTYRALVRAKVAALTAAQKTADDPARDALRRQAMASVHLALSYELPSPVVLMCGLPASGKSWLARELARPFEARVLRSDVLRKQLAGIPPTDHPEGEAADQLYAPEASERLYRRLTERLVETLAQGRSVVLDAMFAERRWRRRFLDVACRLGHPTVVVHVQASEAQTRERMGARRDDRREVSDADWSVHQDAAARFEIPDETNDRLLLGTMSGDDVDLCREQLLERLVAQRLAPLMAPLMAPARPTPTTSPRPTHAAAPTEDPA